MIEERYTIKNELQKDESHTLYEAFDEIFERDVELLETDDLMHLHEMVEKIFKETSIFHYYSAFIEHTTVYYVIKGTPEVTCVKSMPLDDEGLTALMDGFDGLLNSYHKKGLYFKHLSLEWLYVDKEGKYHLLLPACEVNTISQELGEKEIYHELYAIMTGKTKVSPQGLDYIKEHYTQSVFEHLTKKI